jgi:hypothetical protein
MLEELDTSVAMIRRQCSERNFKLESKNETARALWDDARAEKT